MRTLIIASVAALALAANAHAQAPAAPAKSAAAPPAKAEPAAPAKAKPAAGSPVEVKPTGKPGQASAARAAKLTATVKSVDKTTRELTLEANGKTQTVKVGPEVKRFDEIAAGDTIVIEVEQGLLLEYQPEGAATVDPSVAAAGGRAPADKAPAGAAAAGVQATVTVTAIDLPNRVVVFEGPGGNVYQVKAAPQVQIDKLKVGDKLLATYAEAVAIKLEKAAPKAPKKK